MNSAFELAEKVVFFRAVDLSNPMENRRYLNEAEELILDDHFNFIVDFKELNFINSQGLNFLIGLLTKSRTVGGEVVLINISEKVDQLLVMTKLRDVFLIEENEEKALAQLSINQN